MDDLDFYWDLWVDYHTNSWMVNVNPGFLMGFSTLHQPFWVPHVWQLLLQAKGEFPKMGVMSIAIFIQGCPRVWPRCRRGSSKSFTMRCEFSSPRSVCASSGPAASCAASFGQRRSMESARRRAGVQKFKRRHISYIIHHKP